MLKTLAVIVFMLGVTTASTFAEDHCSKKIVGSKQTMTFNISSEKEFTKLTMKCSRTLYDDGVYKATCPTNVTVQPDVGNIDQRSCSEPCNDMTVESCGLDGKDAGTYSAHCTVHNSEGTNDKQMLFCGETK